MSVVQTRKRRRVIRTTGASRSLPTPETLPESSSVDPFGFLRIPQATSTSNPWMTLNNSPSLGTEVVLSPETESPDSPPDSTPNTTSSFTFTFSREESQSNPWLDATQWSTVKTPATPHTDTTHTTTSTSTIPNPPTPSSSSTLEGPPPAPDPSFKRPTFHDLLLFDDLPYGTDLSPARGASIVEVIEQWNIICQSQAYFEKQHEDKSQRLEEAMTRIMGFLREQEVFRAQLEKARGSAKADSERCQALERDLVREKAARTQEKDELLSKMDDIRAQGSARLAEHESKASLQLSEAFDRIATLISQHGMSKVELSEAQASSNAAQSRCSELEKELQELKSTTSKERSDLLERIKTLESDQLNERIKTLEETLAQKSSSLWKALESANALRSGNETLQGLLQESRASASDAASRHETRWREMDAERTAWGEERDALLFKMDTLRDKNVKLVEKVEDLESAKRTSEAETREEKNTRLREAKDAQTKMAKMQETVNASNSAREKAESESRKAAESILRGKAVLAKARTKISDVTTTNEAQAKQVRELLDSTKALGAENATLKSRIKDLELKLSLAETRLRNDGTVGAADFFWDEEEKKSSKAQEEEAERIRLAREKMERMRREEAETERKRKADEEQKRKAEEELKRRKEREEKEIFERWQKASEKEAQRCRLQDSTRFGGLWNKALALTRFRTLLEEFSNIKFSESQPLTFESVPWPSLFVPSKLTPAQMDWDVTEKFFLHAKTSMGASEYKEMLLKAQRTFHPDKWVAKKLLVLDEALRTSLGEAVNMVSQVINNLVSNV